MQTITEHRTPLAEALHSRGWGTEEVAEALRLKYGEGVSDRTVRRWVKGDTDPHPIWKVRVAKLVGEPGSKLWV